MLIYETFNTQYAFPVGFVVVFALLVFAFGFQSPKEPPFEELTLLAADDRGDRKPAGKKRKSKEKRQHPNGDVGLGDTNSSSDSDKKKIEDKSESKQKVQEKKKEKPTKEERKSDKDVEKKTKQKSSPEIKSEGGRGVPTDDKEPFEGGEWVQTLSRKERKKNMKNRRQEELESEISSIVKEYMESKSTDSTPVIHETLLDPDVDQVTSSKESSPAKKKKKTKKEREGEGEENEEVIPENELAVEEISDKAITVARLTETNSNNESPAAKPKNKKNMKKNQGENFEQETEFKKEQTQVVLIESVSEPHTEPSNCRLSEEEDDADLPSADQLVVREQPDISGISNKENIAFDELADCSWQEAKAPKKKKKARKD